MAQCLKVTTFPGKGLSAKTRNQMLGVVANKGNLRISLFDITAVVGVMDGLVVGYVKFQCFVKA